MATKAEVEKTAKTIWQQVVQAPLKRGDFDKAGTPWADLDGDRRDVWLALARWHLRKLAEAYSRGHEQGRADEWCDNA